MNTAKRAGLVALLFQLSACGGTLEGSRQSAAPGSDGGNRDAVRADAVMADTPNRDAVGADVIRGDGAADVTGDVVGDGGRDGVGDGRGGDGADSLAAEVGLGDATNNQPPTVLSTSPITGAQTVPIRKTLMVVFSEALDAATINAATFVVRQGAMSISGVVTYRPGTNTATFTPTADLALDTTYTATISTGVKDAAGNPLAATYTWTFKTSACAQLPVALGAAGNFVVLAGSTVTSTGPTSVTGDLGVSPGTAVTGFPPGTVVGGAVHAGDPAAAMAIASLTVAYDDAAARTLCAVTVAGNLGGQTLTPGLYKSTSSLEITSGDLTLDAQGDGDAVFIFQMASTLTTTSGRQVVLTKGAKAANVFWQVGTSATLGSTSAFHGTVMADQAITMNTGATLTGRVLARVAAVGLDSNTIVKPAP